MAVARLALYSGEREPYRMEANRNGKCSCGLHTSKAAHDTAVEAHLTATLETAIVRAVLPGTRAATLHPAARQPSGWGPRSLRSRKFFRSRRRPNSLCLPRA